MSSVTMTGNHGPGLAVAAKVFDNVSKLEWDFQQGVVNVEYGSPARNIRFGLTGLTTVTHTISGSSHSVTITNA